MKHLIRILCATLLLGSAALAGKTFSSPPPIHTAGSLWGS